MIGLKYIRFLLALLLVFYSCGENKRSSVDRIVKRWIGKEVLFPINSLFSIYNSKDSIDFFVNEVRFSYCNLCRFIRMYKL